MYVFGFIVHKVSGMRWREAAWKSICSKLILRINTYLRIWQLRADGNIIKAREMHIWFKCMHYCIVPIIIRVIYSVPSPYIIYGAYIRHCGPTTTTNHLRQLQIPFDFSPTPIFMFPFSSPRRRRHFQIVLRPRPRCPPRFNRTLYLLLA